MQPFYVQSGLHWQRDELRALRAFLITIDCDRLEPLVVFDMPLADLYGYHWSVTGQRRAGRRQPGRGGLSARPQRAVGHQAGAVVCDARHRGIGAGRAWLPTRLPMPRRSSSATSRRPIDRATGRRVRLTRPFAHLQKKEVMELGRGLPLELTFSCIAPIGGLHCGRCNKCAERQGAFRRLGAEDPTSYAT